MKNKNKNTGRANLEHTLKKGVLQDAVGRKNLPSEDDKGLSSEAPLTVALKYLLLLWLLLFNIKPIYSN